VDAVSATAAAGAEAAEHAEDEGGGDNEQGDDEVAAPVRPGAVAVDRLVE